MPKAWKTVIAIPIIGLFLIMLFYPLNQFIPEGFWPFIPDLLLEFPLMFIFNQIIPGIFWLGFFTIGVIFLKVVIDS